MVVEVGTTVVLIESCLDIHLFDETSCLNISPGLDSSIKLIKTSKKLVINVKCGQETNMF